MAKKIGVKPGIISFNIIFLYKINNPENEEIIIKKNPILDMYSIGLIENENIASKAKFNILDKLYFDFPENLLSLLKKTGALLKPNQGIRPRINLCFSLAC